MGETATHNMSEFVPPSKEKSQWLIGKVIPSLQLPSEAQVPIETWDLHLGLLLHMRIVWSSLKIIFLTLYGYKKQHLRDSSC